jgi:Transcriptional regulator, AbiEi antitoxin
MMHNTPIKLGIYAMTRFYKKPASRLWETAESQQGFFTTKQAIRAGYAETTHAYHVRSGNWVREHRGIYRLAKFPPAPRPDLMLWHLWSQDRQEVPAGVYSHDTALSLYELSDVSPSKLHMTVPNHFRRHRPLPPILKLYRAELPDSDVQEIHGVRVTRPFRTMLDLIESGHVDPSQIKRAVRDAVRRGLIPRAQAVRLGALLNSRRTESKVALKATRFTKKSRLPAAIKSTGGGGFTFADKVGARFLLDLLRVGLPLGPDAGPIVGLEFETRGNGWVLDDQLLVLRNGAAVSRYALSVKSNLRLSKSGLDAEFVSDAWTQWRGFPGSTFDPIRDFLGLATVPAPRSAESDWNALTAEARATTAEHFAERLQAPQYSAAKLRMFESLRGSTADPDKPSVTQAAHLLSRIRVLSFDFESVTSADEDRALATCRELVRSGTLRDAQILWLKLCILARDGRTLGGSFDLPKLVNQLRGIVDLKDFPDHSRDWDVLDEHTRGNIAEVRTVIGDGIHLERSKLTTEMAARIQKNQCVALVGETGSGKSAAVVAFLTGSNFDRLLWLNAQQLTQPGQAHLARSLGLEHSLEVMASASNVKNCLLILDAFEQFRGDTKARALELVRIVSEAGAGQWKILVTVQPHEWINTRRALLDAGIPKIERFDFLNPTPSEVLAKLNDAPGVAALFRRPEIRPILCNLAILHWVIQTDRVRRFDSSRTWIGESELIDWIWQHWLGDSTDKYLRDEILRRLGETEGERISGAVPLESVRGIALQIAGALEREGILRIAESSVKFTHDLAADWARLRALIASGDQAGERIRANAGIPRWARAIRLYAQRLVERDEGLDGWKNFVSGLSGATPEEKLASDLFLDGIIFAANADSLLERIWPHLVADKAQILRRLLTRIVHVATIPDWRYQEENTAEDADLLAAWFRIPTPLYWLPFIRTIHRHADDLAREGVFEAATFCELWLRNMPLEFPGRAEAGDVALTLAREIQGRRAEGVVFVGTADKIVYEAMLHAAPEHPDEVSEIALQLCGRRDDSPSIVDRARRHSEKQHRESIQEGARSSRRARLATPPIFLPSSWGPERDSGPDGPRRRVSEGLRSAVLDTGALTSLASVRPQVAGEVLLAVCIAEPKRESDYDRSPFELPGFAYWRGGSPPIYWKGGFYKFLQIAPTEALDTILRLVHFATERWIEKALRRQPTDDDRRACSLEIVLHNRTVRWVGNATVFSWHRDVPGIPDIVVCALMALEKWLYDRMDKNESIDGWVGTILEKGDSLAFAGVLIAVGLRQPKLLTGLLRPFLGNLFLHEFHIHLAFQEQQRLWAIGWAFPANQGERAVAIAREWHQMPHRTLSLRDVAIHFLLFDGETGKFLSERHAEWMNSLKSGGSGRERLEAFVAQFEKSNYTLTPLEDGSTQVEYRPPAHLQARAQDAQEKNTLSLIVMQIPVEARRLLAENHFLAADRLEGYYKALRHIADADAHGDQAFHKAKLQAISAGIALLVTHHRPWLAENPAAKQWCVDTVRDMASAPLDDSYSPDDISGPSTEAFLGEAGVALLTEIQEHWVKRAVLTGATGYYYRSSFHVLTAAFRHRAQLGAEFGRLQNVVILWAILRRSALPIIHSQEGTAVLTRYREAILRRYLKGRVPAAPISLLSAERIGQRLLRRVQRKLPGYWDGPIRDRDDELKVSRKYLALDLSVLQNGLGFLAEMTERADESERSEVTRRNRELLEFELGTVPEIPQEDVDVEIHGSLYEFDIWAFERAVQAMMKLTPSEARQFWKPILRLPVPAHEWIREFLVQWFRLGLISGSSTFQAIWSEMISYILDSPTWTPARKHGWFHVHQIVGEVLGLPSAIQSLGQAKHTHLVEAMSPLYERWAAQWIEHPDLATPFAYFLSMDSGTVLLPAGIRHLAAHLDSFSDFEWRRERLTDSLSAAVRACWKKYQNELRADPEFWKAFLAILNALCARNDAIALAIRSEATRQPD